MNNEKIDIPKCHVQFKRWTGQPIQNTFGNKPLLDFNGKPMFAELLIMNLFLQNSWNSRWVETYGKSKLKPIYLNNWIDDKYKNQIDKPIENLYIQTLLNKIAEKNGSNFGGCWDVLAWKNEYLIFVESKRSKKDFLQSTQNKWLKAGFEVGLKRENFLMVEWKLK
ncbi:hypothetical protein [Owenweeksia hongkongensis]|uniref:hypothetical protein n=1 Tax=Owenweeksia hongkongensis TaxID=253245 RepID=UPI003A92820F